MKKMKQMICCNWKTKEGKIKILATSIFVLISLIFFYSFIYNDIIETMRMGMDVWYSLFDGELNYFYARRTPVNPVAYPKTVQGVYDFPIYIVFAIWNFPLWIAENFFQVDVFQSPLCLMWGKTLILLSTVLIVAAIYRLCRTMEMGDEISYLICILFVTSNFFMTSVIMMCAYDIISLYFVILGMHYWMKNDMKGFILCFMCAIPLKFFALLVFVTLLLLREKKILRIAGAMLCSVLPILVFRILIPCRAVFEDPASAAISLGNIFKATNLSGLAIIYTLGNQIEMSNARLFPSLLMWGILYLVCYFMKPECETEYRRWGLYFSFLTFAILFVFCTSHPYWLLIMLPMMVMMMGMNRKYLYVNLILETVMTWGMIILQMMRFPWCFGSALVAGMFWPSILGKQETFIPYTVDTVIQKLTNTEYGPKGYLVGFGFTAFVGCILVFAVLNWPGWRRGFVLIQGNEKMIKGWIFVRILAGFAIALFPILLYAIGVYS